MMYKVTMLIVLPIHLHILPRPHRQQNHLLSLLPLSHPAVVALPQLPRLSPDRVDRPQGGNALGGEISVVSVT